MFGGKKKKEGIRIKSLLKGRKITKKLLIVDAVMIFLAASLLIMSPEPSKVEGLRLTSSTYDTVNIEWLENPKAKGYRIYRAVDGGEFEYFELTDDNKYQDRKIRTGKKYRYAVVPVNGLKDGELDQNNIVEALPKLEKPTLSVETKHGKVELRMSYVAGSLGYVITRDDEVIGQTNKTDYVDEDARPDEPHTYTVKAVRYAEDPVYSEPSNTAEVELYGIKNVIMNAKADSINIEWDINEHYDKYMLYKGEELVTETEETHCEIEEYNIDELYNIRIVGFDSESDTQSPEINKNIKVLEEPMDNEAARKAACEWGLEIAADNSFAYGTGSTAHRTGCYFCGTNRRIKGSGYEKTYCCNPFVHACYAHGAGDPQMLSDCQRGRSVGMSSSNYTQYGNWENVGKPSVSNLEDGDVLVSSGHVMLYAGNGEVVHAKTEGWGANTIGTDNAARYYGMVSFVMRYTGTGSGTMFKVREVDEDGNVIETAETPKNEDSNEEGN